MKERLLLSFIVYIFTYTICYADTFSKNTINNTKHKYLYIDPKKEWHQNSIPRTIISNNKPSSKSIDKIDLHNETIDKYEVRYQKKKWPYDEQPKYHGCQNHDPNMIITSGRCMNLKNIHKPTN